MWTRRKNYVFHAPHLSLAAQDYYSEQYRRKIYNGDAQVVASFERGVTEETMDRVVECVNALHDVKNPSKVGELLQALKQRDKEKLRQCLNEVIFDATSGESS